MDISQGLSAASTGLSILKQLREIDAQVDAAAYKMAIADLTEALADTKIALSEAKELIAERNGEIKNLKATITALRSGDDCPICRTGLMQTERVSDHPKLGKIGVKNYHQKCDNPECSHSDIKMVDKQNVLKS